MRPVERAGEAGFTLLELQVALALAAGVVMAGLALTAVAVDGGQTARGLAALEDRARLIDGILYHTIRHPDPLTLDLRPDPNDDGVMTVYQEGQPAVPGIEVLGIAVLRPDPDRPDERIWMERDPEALAGEDDLADALTGVYAVRFDFRVHAEALHAERTRIVPRPVS